MKFQKRGTAAVLHSALLETCGCERTGSSGESHFLQIAAMKPFHAWLSIILLSLVGLSFGSDAIPEAAWRRPLGLPLENPGGKKPEIKDMIDDGYWQGAPVGGFGAETVVGVVMTNGVLGADTLPAALKALTV